MMITIYNPAHTQHDPPHEFLDGALIPSYESPARAEMIRAAIESAGLGPIQLPHQYGLEPLRAVHSDAYLAYLEHAYEHWVAAGGSPDAVIPGTLAVRWMNRLCEHPLAAPGYYAADTSAPIVAGTYAAALDSANTALTGAELLLQGHRAAYALCRPPGHHAGHDLCGGYCYLNNAAIATAYLLHNQAEHRRVAILDIDYHHGNGTQQIFYERNDVLVVSIHADPSGQYPYFVGYPDEHGVGAGMGYNLNLALPEGVTDHMYLEALDTALTAIAEYMPHYLVLSAGFDTFGGDPVALVGSEGFALTQAAYSAIGLRIAHLNLPTLIVQEGGYATEALGQNVVALLRGFES